MRWRRANAEGKQRAAINWDLPRDAADPAMTDIYVSLKLKLPIEPINRAH